jgi:hypothetical protein
MIINLPYGNRELTLELPEEQLLQIVQPPPPAPSQGSIKILEEAFKHPIASNTLKQIVEEKKARRVVIVVNDITRPTPYRLILPPPVKGTGSRRHQAPGHYSIGGFRNTPASYPGGEYIHLFRGDLQKIPDRKP